MDREIIGDRVILRRLRDEDAPFFARWYSEPDIMFRCGFTAPTTAEEELRAIHAPSPDRDWYAVTDKWK